MININPYPDLPEDLAQESRNFYEPYVKEKSSESGLSHVEANIEDQNPP